MTGKCIKKTKEPAISKRLLHCDSPITFDDFDIFASDSNKFKLLVKESLRIKRKKPFLYRMTKSFLLDFLD